MATNPYVKTAWNNDSTPAISAENLNKIENGIFDASKKSEASYDSIFYETGEKETISTTWADGFPNAQVGNQISITSDNHAKYCKVDVSGLDKVYATFNKGGYYYHIYFTNSSDIVLSRTYLTTETGRQEQVTDYEVSVPENAKYIYLAGYVDATTAQKITKIIVFNKIEELASEADTSYNAIFADMGEKQIISSTWSSGFPNAAVGNAISITSDSNIKYTKVDVSELDTVYATFNDGGYIFHIYFTDSNDIVLSRTYLTTATGYQNQITDYEVTVPETAKYIYLAGYVNQDTVQNVSKPVITNKIDKNTKKIDGLTSNVIRCWGDSLTDGSGSTVAINKDGYIYYLQQLIGNDYVVKNYGIAGEKSKRIAQRRGAYSIYANPFTIPASGDVTGVEIIDEFEETIGDFFNRGGRAVESEYNLSKFAVNPVIIGGIEGNLKQIATGDTTYTFSRIESGNAVTLDRPTFIDTFGNRQEESYCEIYWLGTNDMNGTVDVVIESINNMIKNNKYGRYIVCGLTQKKNSRTSFNEALCETYGKHFVDLYKYICDYGCADNGLTPTAEDEELIAEGYPPISLTVADHIHFNDYGYYAIAKRLYAKGIELKYWS